MRGVERVLPLGIELERPLAGEERAMRGERPRGGRQGAIEPDPLASPRRQVGRGVSRIAVEAQVGGADGIPDDQHDVAGAGGGGGNPATARASTTARRPDERAARTISRPSDRRRDRSHRPRAQAADDDRAADRPGQPRGQEQAAGAVDRHPEQAPTRSPASRTATTRRPARGPSAGAGSRRPPPRRGSSAGSHGSRGRSTGNPSRLRKDPSGFRQSLLKTIRPRSR